MRIVTLSLRFAANAKARTALLSVLVAVGMGVLMIVAELSRVSSVGLDDAISEDAGQTGSYVVTLSTNVGLTVPELAQRVGAAIDPSAATPPRMVETLATVRPECPPFASLGDQPILVLRDMHGRAVGLPFGTGLPSDTRLCMDGQEIPADALYLPTSSQQRVWGRGLFVRQDYEAVAHLSATSPATYRFTVVTGRDADEQSAIQEAVTAALSTDAARFGVDLTNQLDVARVDQGPGIRNASRGVNLVYQIIGWGVLLLAGLGLLVSEMIVVRQRMWFFGLARALGARNASIAVLVSVDVLVVLVLGTCLALGVLTLASPAISSFASHAFAVDAHVVRLAVIPRLALGGLVLLLLAAGLPAVQAMRQDPVDVLESGRS